MASIVTLRQHLGSPNKDVRLKALKLILTHEEATPLDLVKCLCSEDNRNFEFLEKYGLGDAMRAAWPRLKGVENPEVYEFVESLYLYSPHEHGHHVIFMLELLATQRAWEMLDKIDKSGSAELSPSIKRTKSIIAKQLRQQQ
jgi:hypothetical protein